MRKGPRRRQESPVAYYKHRSPTPLAQSHWHPPTGPPSDIVVEHTLLAILQHALLLTPAFFLLLPCLLSFTPPSCTVSLSTRRSARPCLYS